MVEALFPAAAAAPRGGHRLLFSSDDDDEEEEEEKFRTAERAKAAAPLLLLLSARPRAASSSRPVSREEEAEEEVEAAVAATATTDATAWLRIIGIEKRSSTPFPLIRLPHARCERSSSNTGSSNCGCETIWSYLRGHGREKSLRIENSLTNRFFSLCVVRQR